ncbi:MAG: hypothetical protein GY866_11095 [Proteobacteria bacterium]|nr:hypothetical protein [Pseudomonadota bacterium]
MFEYYCTRSRLINWVSSQVDTHHGVIFPRQKGWNFYLRNYYPLGQKINCLLILVANEKECLAFVPLDDTVDDQGMGHLFKPKFVQSVRTEIDLPLDSFQVIFLTSEKCRNRMVRNLDKIHDKAALLVLNQDKPDFAKGGFDNPRLEYRLSQLDFDPEMIPDFISVNLVDGDEGTLRSLFYQRILHYLNRCWVQGRNEVRLKKVLEASISIWKQLRKDERNKLTLRIKGNLETIIDQFFPELLRIYSYQKKTNSLPELVIALPEPPTTRKSINTWLRKQNQALEFLRVQVEQISIDFQKLDP